MRRNIHFSTFTAILCAVAAMIAAPQVLHSQNSSYSNNAYGFDIHFPPGWSVSEPGKMEFNGKQVIFAAIAQSEHSSIAITVSDQYTSDAYSKQETPLSRKDIDDQWIDLASTASAMNTVLTSLNSLPQFHLYQSEVTPFDGTKAIHLQFFGLLSINGQEPQPARADSYMVTKNGILFAVTSYTEFDYFSQFAKRTSDALLSFHVDPLPLSVLEATSKSNRSGFFRRVFSNLVQDLTGNALLWVVGIVIVGIVAGIGGLVGLIRKKDHKHIT